MPKKIAMKSKINKHKKNNPSLVGKSNLLTPLLLSLFFLTISCSTEEATIEPAAENPEVPAETNFVEENPLPQFLAATRYNEHTVLCSNTAVFDEIGFKFKAMEKGTINSLLIKIPIVNNNLVVAITDFSTSQVIRTEVVNVTAANAQTVKTIVPVELEKGKTYFITMRTNNYYRRFRADFTQASYPVTVGNIKILAPVTTAFSPDGILGSSGNFYSGDCSFTFLRTE
jgi:hypothetical protein